MHAQGTDPPDLDDEGEPGARRPAGESARALAIIQRIVGATSLVDRSAVAEEWAKFSLAPVPGQDCMPYVTARNPYTLPGGKRRIKVATLEERLGWWDNWAANSYPWLAEAARRLLSITITTGAAERNWSRWGLVATPQRSRLGVSRAEKLVYVRGNLLTGHSADNALALDTMECEDNE